MAAIQSPPVQSMYPALMQDVSEILIVPARGWNRLQCAVKISWETEHLALYYRDISWIFLITCIWKVIYGLLSLHEASSEITGYLLRWWLHYYITCVLPFYNKFYIHLYMENQNWTCPIYLFSRLSQSLQYLTMLWFITPILTLVWMFRMVVSFEYKNIINPISEYCMLLLQTVKCDRHCNVWKLGDGFFLKLRNRHNDTFHV